MEVVIVVLGLAFFLFEVWWHLAPDPGEGRRRRERLEEFRRKRAGRKAARGPRPPGDGGHEREGARRERGD